jgi:hypothetical protein
MIRWACFPILTLVLAACAAAPAEKPAEVGEPRPHRPPPIPTLTADNAIIRRAPPVQAPAAAEVAPPAHRAHVPRPAAARTETPAAVPQPAKPPESSAKTETVARPETAAPPETESPPAADAKPDSAPVACPELALSYCIGHLELPPSGAGAQLPHEKLQAVRRCELDIYLKPPSGPGTGAPNPPAPLGDRCFSDDASIRAGVDERIRSGH